MNRFLFRCDISPQAGAGHLNRCLVLARELKQRGGSIFFVLRLNHFNTPDDLIRLCDGIEYLDWGIDPIDDAQDVIRIYRAHGIHATIIDHYRADANYQRLLYDSKVKWLQFDGCYQKKLWADWVLDSSVASTECDYQSARQRDKTLFLLGPEYALLRKEFARWQPDTTYQPAVNTILLTFGGGDDQGATVFALDALKGLDPDIKRLILVSSSYPRLSDIKDWMKTNSNIHTTLKVDEKEIARSMSQADMGITAGGMTTFETAAMGLPTLIIQIADNQKRNVMGWQKIGVAIDLGPIQSLDPQILAQQTALLIKDHPRRKKMSSRGKSRVDCLGAERVAQIISN